MSDDQRFASRRPDVLTFSSDALMEDLTLSGPLVADLMVSISTTDADFVVKLIDVFPDEFKYNVTSSFYATIFNDSYTSALKQYQLLTQLDVSYDNYKAIGMIMKAYHFQS